MSFAQTRADFACCATFAPTGNLIASGSIDRDVCVWNTSTKKVCFDESFRKKIVCVAFSLDGSLLLACSTACILCWHTETWQRKFKRYLVNKATCATFALDNRMLVTGEADGSVGLRDISTNRLVTFLWEDGSPITSIVCSPNGKTLLIGSANGAVSICTVSILDDGNRMRMHKLYSHKSLVNGITFSPDGSALATASADGTVCMWRRTGGQNIDNYALRVFPLLHKSFQGVAFSSSGDMLAAFSQDGAICIWNDINGESACLVRMLQNAGRVLCVKFAPHDNALLFCMQHGIDDKWQCVLDYETMRALAPCLDVGVAPYVVLDIVNFLLANASKIQLADEEFFFHGKKIAFISRLQQQCRQRCHF